MNRGSRPGGTPKTTCRRCFNEAPIHESGKCTRRTFPSMDAPCFNEAPIHESGKLYHVITAGDDIGASMRPRFMNRGSNVRFDLSQLGDLRFNEAPIHESGKC